MTSRTEGCDCSRVSTRLKWSGPGSGVHTQVRESQDRTTASASLDERGPTSTRALRRSEPEPYRDWARRQAGQTCAALADMVGFVLTPNGGRMVRRADSPRDPWLAKDVSATVRAWERRRGAAREAGEGRWSTSRLGFV